MKRPTSMPSALVALAALALTSCSTATQTRPTTPATEAPTAPPAATVTAGPEPSPTTTVDEVTTGAPGPTAGAGEDATVTGPASEVSAPAGPDAGTDPGPAAAALALAPEDTAYLTLTDWARIKARLGASDLTGESIQTDRSEFWRAVGPATVLLTDGALREENSRLGLRYGVTQDDARWEVRWTAEGDRPQGLALRLREDLDLEGLQHAVEDEVPGLEGAQVLEEAHLLLRDPATDLPLGAVPPVVVAFAGDAESELVVPGCLSWPTALGVDATVEEQDAVVDGAGDAVEDLLDPQAWAMAFTGRSATVTVVYPEGTSQAQAGADAAARVALAEGWPTTESVGWGDAFGLAPDGPEEGYAVHARDGFVVVTIDYRVVNTTAAATVALAGLVPAALCADIDWLEEPTGL